MPSFLLWLEMTNLHNDIPLYCSCQHASNTHHTPYTTILWLTGLCPGQLARAGNRRNNHPIVVTSHPLSAFSIYYDPRHRLYSNYVPHRLFQQSLSKFSLVYLLAWHPQLHTPYISYPQSLSCFHNTCPYHCKLFCKTDAGEVESYRKEVLFWLCEFGKRLIRFRDKWQDEQCVSWSWRMVSVFICMYIY